MSVVYMVASGKGGTGKSMFATNLGATLALQGHRTLILDMDMGLRNIDLYLGLENNIVYDCYDVMKGHCRIRQALVRDRRFGDNLYVMAASPDRLSGDITPLHVQVLTEKLRESFEYIIIDSPSGVDDGTLLAAAGADVPIIVTTPENAALRDAGSLERELRRLGFRHIRMVLNRFAPDMMISGYVPKLREIMTTVNASLLGIIQSDPNINISTNLGVPIVLKEDTYIARNFRQIAAELTGETE